MNYIIFYNANSIYFHLGIYVLHEVTLDICLFFHILLELRIGEFVARFIFTVILILHLYGIIG